MEMTLKYFVVRIKDVLIQPKTFWKDQKNMELSQAALFLGFFFPLIILVSLSEFLGEFIDTSYFYIGYAGLKALRIIILYTLFYFLSVFLTNELIKTFGGKKNIAIAQKLVVFSLTPMLLVSLISGLFSFLYVINILGFYSIYVFWIGVLELLDLTERNKSRYILTSVLANVFIYGFLSIFLSKLLMAYI